MTKKRVYSRYTIEAAQLLGRQIKLRRKQKRWSEQELAQRAGMSRTTLQKIEKGDLGVALGLFFEAAILLGINLFDEHPSEWPRPGMQGSELQRHIQRSDEILRLLPAHIYPHKVKLDDDF